MAVATVNQPPWMIEIRPVSSQPQKLDSMQSEDEQLRSLLQQSYGMPTKEWWASAESRFQLLRKYLEQDAPEVDISSSSQTYNDITNGVPWAWEDIDISDTNSENVHYASQSETSRGKESRYPKIKVLKACTFLMGITSVAEPLICKAFGTIAPQRYEEVFWEKATKLKDEQRVRLEVISIKFSNSQEVTFFLRLDGYNFKLRYLQWPTLVRGCKDILNAPRSFTDDIRSPKTNRLFLENLQHDERRRQKLDNDDEYKIAFHYIRACAMERGLYRRKNIECDGRRSTSPAEILDILIRISVDGYPKHEYYLSKILFEFFVQFSSGFKSSSDRLRYPYPRAEDKVYEWKSHLLRLRGLSVQSKMDCPIYVRVAVVYVGSEIAGGLWLRDVVEPGVRELSEAMSAAFCNGTIALPWQYRLTRQHGELPSGQPHGSEPYEGFYIIGVSHPSDDLSEDMVRHIANDWEARVENRTSKKIDKEDNAIRIMTATVLTAGEMKFECYTRCLKTWPYKPLEPPHDLGLDPESSKSYAKAQHRFKNNNGATTGFLHPAKEILKRIRGDQKNFNIDEWVVGYEDRHTPAIQEKTVSEWQLESSHESWIPEHRIEYFKHVSEDGTETIKWEKRTKIDLISKSAGVYSAHESEAEELLLTKTQRKQKQREEWKNMIRESTSDTENDTGNRLQRLQAEEVAVLMKLRMKGGRLKGMTNRQSPDEQAAVAIRQMDDLKALNKELKLRRQGKKNKKRAGPAGAR